MFTHFDFFAGIISAKAGICLIRVLLRAALVNYLVNWVVSLDHRAQHWVRLEATARREVPRRAADYTASMDDRCTTLIIQARSIKALTSMRGMITLIVVQDYAAVLCDVSQVHLLVGLR